MIRSRLGDSICTFVAMVVVCLSLSGCTEGPQILPTPAAASDASSEAPTTSSLIFVNESVIYVAWENGTQSAFYLLGPGEIAFIPDEQWRYVLRGATSNAAHFFFNLPTVSARKVLWRVVWIPQRTVAQLFVAYVDPDLAPGVPRPHHDVATVTPFDTGGSISQDVTHPLTSPRTLDVDITEAFNAAIRNGQEAIFLWQVKRMDEV